MKTVFIAVGSLEGAEERGRRPASKSKRRRGSCLVAEEEREVSGGASWRNGRGTTRTCNDSNALESIEYDCVDLLQLLCCDRGGRERMGE